MWSAIGCAAKLRNRSGRDRTRGHVGTPEDSVGESQRRRRVEPLSYPRLGDLADCTREPSSEVAYIRLNNSWAAGEGGWLRSV